MTNLKDEIERLKNHNGRLKSFLARMDETGDGERAALLHDPEVGELLGEYAPPLSPSLERAATIADVMVQAQRHEAELVAHVNRQLGRAD